MNNLRLVSCMKSNTATFTGTDWLKTRESWCSFTRKNRELNRAKIEDKCLAVTVENVYRPGQNNITVYIFVPQRRGCMEAQ